MYVNPTSIRYFMRGSDLFTVSFHRLQGVLHSVLCSRLLLRLKGAYVSLSDRTLRSAQPTTISMSVFVGTDSCTETGKSDEVY